jgi:hypothetical protein
MLQPLDLCDIKSTKFVRTMGREQAAGWSQSDSEDFADRLEKAIATSGGMTPRTPKGTC